MSAITDIWNFDSNLIASLTLEQVIKKINSVKVSPSLGHQMDFSDLFGGVTKDKDGNIISAKYVKTLWMVHLNFTLVDMDVSENNAGTSDWVRFV